MQMIYYALAVRDGGQVIGYVRTALSDELVHRRLSRMSAARSGRHAGRDAAQPAAFVLVRLASGPARWRRSVPALKQPRRGDSDTAAAPCSAQTELDDLARSINALAANLRAQLEAATGERNQMQTILRGMVEGVIAVDAEERDPAHQSGRAALLYVADTAAAGPEALGGAARSRSARRAARGAGRGTADDRSRCASLGREATRRWRRSARRCTMRRAGRSGAVVVLHDVSRIGSWRRAARVRGQRQP